MYHLLESPQSNTYIEKAFLWLRATGDNVWERIQGTDQHAEKSTGISFPIGEFMKDTYSASDRTVIAAGNFHNGPGSTHCGFCHLQMPHLNGGCESVTAWGSSTSNAKASIVRPGQTEMAFPSHPLRNQFYFSLKLLQDMVIAQSIPKLSCLIKKIIYFIPKSEPPFHFPRPMEIPYVLQNLSWLH